MYVCMYVCMRACVRACVQIDADAVLARARCIALVLDQDPVFAEGQYDIGPSKDHPATCPL